MSAPSGTEAERVLWTQWARRSVGNRKERLRDYAGFPDGNSESELGNVKERLRDYYVSRKQK